MKTLTSKQLFGLAFGIMIVSNILVFWGVYQNRSSKPTSVISLTEREMPMRSYYRHHRDLRDRHLKVRTMVHTGVRYKYYKTPLWLDEAKLQTLGYDTQKAKANINDIHRRETTKVCYVALEFDGNTYQEYLASEIERYEQKVTEYNATKHKSFTSYIKYDKRELKRTKEQESRLFVIDASQDYQTLRQKYPKEQYIITQAKIQLRKHYQNKNYHLRGYIMDVMIPNIHLSKSNLKKLKDILKNATKEKKYSLHPKYTITLAFGSRLEPYIVDIKAIKYK